MNTSESESKAEVSKSEEEPKLLLRSEDILQGHKEVRIDHEGVTYRLLVTRNGKLILQK